MLRGNSGAQTTVTFPKAGRYELTLWACDRYGQQYSSNPDKFGVNQVNLLFGKASGTMEQFGTVLAYGRKFTKFRFMLPEVESGDYVLRNTPAAPFVARVSFMPLLAMLSGVDELLCR